MTKLSAEQLTMIRELKMSVRYDLARSLLDHIAAVEAERDALTRVADAAEEWPPILERQLKSLGPEAVESTSYQYAAARVKRLIEALRAAGRLP